MTVLVFAYDYPPLDGGIARLMGAVARTQNAAGRSVEVLSVVHPDAAGEPVRVTRVPEPRVVRELACLPRLRRARDELVVCARWYPEAALCMGAGVRHVAVMAHGAELLEPAARWRRRAWAGLRRAVLENASVVLANSDYTAAKVAAVAPRARVESVPLAVDEERFEPSGVEQAKHKLDVDGRLTLATVARVHLFKGHDTVIRAIARLPLTARQKVVYLIAGRGPAEAALRQLTRSLGLGDCVRFLGFVSEDDIANVYRAADLYVMMTREDDQGARVEGFGLAFLEAQAGGTPVLGTRTGGISSAVEHGEGGWLVAQDDVDAVTARLTAALANPSELEEHGRLARARVLREFTWDHYSTRFERAVTHAGLRLR